MPLQPLPPHQAHLNPHGADGPYLMYSGGENKPTLAVLTPADIGIVVEDPIDGPLSKERIMDIIRDYGGKFAVVGNDTRTTHVVFSPRGLEHTALTEGLLTHTPESRFIGGGIWNKNFVNFRWGSEGSQKKFGYDRPTENGEVLLADIKVAIEESIKKLR